MTGVREWEGGNSRRESPRWRNERIYQVRPSYFKKIRISSISCNGIINSARLLPTPQNRCTRDGTTRYTLRTRTYQSILGRVSCIHKILPLLHITTALPSSIIVSFYFFFLPAFLALFSSLDWSWSPKLPKLIKLSIFSLRKKFSLIILLYLRILFSGVSPFL